MYRVAFKFNAKVPSVNNELTIPQNKRSLDKKLLFENGKGSYNGKEMQNINHAYAPMDRKRALMYADRDTMPNGRFASSKGITNSVSMTQLYRDKQLTGAVPMFADPSLQTMYFTYMIQQPENVPKSLFDHDAELVVKAKKARAEFQGKRYHSDRLMSALGTSQFGSSPSKWRRQLRDKPRTRVPKIFVPPPVLKADKLAPTPAILATPCELLKTARPVEHDGFEETKEGAKSDKAKTPAKAEDGVEVAMEGTDGSGAVYGHSDVASKVMQYNKSGIIGSAKTVAEIRAANDAKEANAASSSWVGYLTGATT